MLCHLTTEYYYFFYLTGAVAGLGTHSSLPWSQYARSWDEPVPYHLLPAFFPLVWEENGYTRAFVVLTCLTLLRGASYNTQTAVLLSAVGGFIMSTATNSISLLIGLELQTLSTYVLVGQPAWLLFTFSSLISLVVACVCVNLFFVSGTTSFLAAFAFSDYDRPLPLVQPIVLIPLLVLVKAGLIGTWLPSMTRTASLTAMWSFPLLSSFSAVGFLYHWPTDISLGLILLTMGYSLYGIYSTDSVGELAGMVTLYSVALITFFMGTTQGISAYDLGSYWLPYRITLLTFVLAAYTYKVTDLHSLGTSSNRLLLLALLIAIAGFPPFGVFAGKLRLISTYFLSLGTFSTLLVVFSALFLLYCVFTLFFSACVDWAWRDPMPDRLGWTGVLVAGLVTAASVQLA